MPSDRDMENQLFVGGIHNSVKEEELEDFFRQFGTLTCCELKQSRDKPFAFVLRIFLVFF